VHVQISTSEPAIPVASFNNCPDVSVICNFEQEEVDATSVTYALVVTLVVA